MIRRWIPGLLILTAMTGAGDEPKVPRSWSSAPLETYRVPLAGLGAPPTMVSERDYYALPENNLKTYPVYRPEKEPAGYLDWLRQQDPKPLVDVATLKTDADWIAAGKEVFYGRELPRFSGSEHNLQLIRDPRVLDAYRLNTTKDGVLIGLRYVVRKKGAIELGTDTCAMCHVQMTASGDVIEGPPNVHTPFGPLMGDLTRRYQQISPAMLEERRRRHMREDYRVPYIANDPNAAIAGLPAEEIARLYEQNPVGVHARTNTSLIYPVKISNLIGIKDLRYFDHTATARHRDVTDLMRYSASIADVTDALTAYGSGPAAKMNLEHMGLGGGIRRTPDALLYALARYIYSLKPPPNPNPVTAQTRRGEQVFRKASCVNCHTPPLYTNNRLTLAEGFEPPAAHARQVQAMALSLGTDPGLAMLTRKGTGYYRVPSLRMIYLDRCFLHDGSIGTLEEMFDPARLSSTFRSSNWHSSMPAHAVKGHPFGLNLAPDDRAALIAFLRTL